MKYLRKFDSVSEMNTALASSEISILGLAYNNGTPVINNKKIIPPDPTVPFYVENITNNNETLTIKTRYWQEPGFLIEKSTDGSIWSSLGTTSSTPLTETLAPGAKLYLRATTNAWGQMNMETSIKGMSKVGGNIMSLLYGSSFTGNETTFPSDSMFNFSCLFYDNEDINRNLVDASQLVLPATTLTRGCYQQMFDGCTSLTATPALPATTLAEGCYGKMFYQCTSLTTAPALPATSLSSACYNSMFWGCTALTTAPALPATTLAYGCYNSMFDGCTALTTAPALPATTLAESCYSDMFNSCTALTTVPELPATTLTDGCYNCMFWGCTNLNYIKCLATDISASQSTNNWVRNVAASGTFVKDSNMLSWTTGNNGIPSGWTVEDA